jgi:hypothetical protein
LKSQRNQISQDNLFNKIDSIIQEYHDILEKVKSKESGEIIVKDRLDIMSKFIQQSWYDRMVE